LLKAAPSKEWRAVSNRLNSVHATAGTGGGTGNEQNNLIAASRWDDSQGQPYYCTFGPGSCSAGGDPTIGPFPAASACVFDTPEAGICP